MTTAVLGPGAVGGALAVPLALSRERVICVGREETTTAIAGQGITLLRDGIDLHANVDACEELEEPVDLLLVSVKATGLVDAVARITVDPGLVLPLLNGLEHMELLRARFSRVTAGTIGRLEAYREEPTRIVQHAQAVVTLSGSTVPAPLERAGIEVRLGGSETDVLWEKLARQAPLAVLTAVTGRPVGDVRDDPRLRLALEEACAVAAAAGAATTFADQWSIIESLPFELTTSTARDVAAGRPSELDAIAGAVVRAGLRLGVPTPTLERLLEQCRA
jgi:2-dehydropantoate 2-reductase